MAVVSYLIAGPGAGGGSQAAGGGAAGQVLIGSDTITSGSFPIVVGSKGTGVGFAADGNPGSGPSSFNVHSAGAGNGGKGNGPVANGGSNASYAGGTGADDGLGDYGGGGGAGAAGVGGNADPSGTGGNGGTGTTSSISGSSVVYGSGGGGTGFFVKGVGGTGAGDGAVEAATFRVGATSATTPGSGGGGGNNHSNGGDGADGVVILSYTTGALTAFGGVISTSGGNTIHTFSPVSDNTFRVTAVYSLVASPGSFGITGNLESHTFSKAYLAGTYSLTGFLTGLNLVLVAGKLAALPGDYTITGSPVGFAVSYALIASPGSYSITGLPSNFRLFISPFAPASRPLWALQRFDAKVRREETS